jgi:hypothetical protein
MDTIMIYSKTEKPNFNYDSNEFLVLMNTDPKKDDKNVKKTKSGRCTLFSLHFVPGFGGRWP